MRPNTYDVLIVEISCSSQDVQLLSACSDKFLTVQNDRIFANQNTESPQNFTMQLHSYTKQNLGTDIQITFYVKERGAYICFNQKWQPRLMKKKNLKDEHSCHFREHMDHGYFTYSSVKDPQKYLGFMKNGRPINYDRMKNDEKCRRIFKRKIENSSNDVIVAYQETSTVSSTLGNRKSSSSSSSRIQQKTHSNRIDMSKPRSTSRAKTAHSVRHHHNELPLRHPHQHHQQHNNINNIKNNDSFNSSSSSSSSSSSTKQLVNENFNAIYNNPSNNVNSNNISDNNEKVTTHHIRHQHHRKMHQQHQQQQPTFSEISPMNDLDDQQGYVTNYDDNNNNKNKKNNNNMNRNPNKDKWNKDEIETTNNNNNSNNNNNNNNTSNCSSDDSETDKHLKGKKNVRGRNNNAHANEKQQNNKCNNRKSKKNNENVRHSRKSNQKNSHKINRTPEN